jgi:hypothetical protein
MRIDSMYENYGHSLRNDSSTSFGSIPTLKRRSGKSFHSVRSAGDNDDCRRRLWTKPRNIYGERFCMYSTPTRTCHGTQPHCRAACFRRESSTCLRIALREIACRIHARLSAAPVRAVLAGMQALAPTLKRHAQGQADHSRHNVVRIAVRPEDVGEDIRYAAPIK